MRLCYGRCRRRRGLRVRILDEVHNLLGGSSAQQRTFRNVLRSLGNTLRIPLVCVGTREAYLAMRSDEQLENRFEPFTLPRWQADADYASLLASFEATFPLRYPSHLSQPPLSTHILAQSEGTIGEISTFLTRAATLAIRSASIYPCCHRWIIIRHLRAAGCSSAPWPRAREMTRWPLHPAPQDDETLSSWLTRLAVAYEMAPIAFCHDALALPNQSLQELDDSPPARLITTLVDHTGWS